MESWNIDHSTFGRSKFWPPPKISNFFSPTYKPSFMGKQHKHNFPLVAYKLNISVRNSSYFILTIAVRTEPHRFIGEQNVSTRCASLSGIYVLSAQLVKDIPCIMSQRTRVLHVWDKPSCECEYSWTNVTRSLCCKGSEKNISLVTFSVCLT